MKLCERCARGKCDKCLNGSNWWDVNGVPSSPGAVRVCRCSCSDSTKTYEEMEA